MNVAYNLCFCVLPGHLCLYAYNAAQARFSLHLYFIAPPYSQGARHLPQEILYDTGQLIF